MVFMAAVQQHRDLHWTGALRRSTHSSAIIIEVGSIVREQSAGRSRILCSDVNKLLKIIFHQ